MNENHFLRSAMLGVAACVLAGCVTTRAQTANEAKSTMVGMSKERVLACMGTPERTMTEGSTEVWTYASGGENRSLSVSSATAQGRGTTTATGQLTGNVYAGQATSNATVTAFGSGSTVTRRRYCDVHIVMRSGVVQAVNYSGRTGGLLTEGEQCAYAVQNCLAQ